MKIAKPKTTLIITLLIIFFIVILYYLYKYTLSQKIIIENFNESETKNALSSPIAPKWMFNDSNNWYTIKQNGFSIPISNMGINSNTPNITISFLLFLKNASSSWRNIFHFTDNNSDGSRLPAMFVYPDNTSRFHIRFDADGNSNNGVDTTSSIPLYTPLLITLIFTKTNFKLYIGSVKVLDNPFNNIKPRTSNTKLYIGDPWYGSDGGVLIKNFTVYDGALTEQDVTGMVAKLSGGGSSTAGPKGDAGPAGPAGPAGASGVPGLPGLPGPVGISGNAGPVGASGPAGLDGKQGDIGPIGPIGPKGDIGNIGPPGPAGKQGIDSKFSPY